MDWLETWTNSVQATASPLTLVLGLLQTWLLCWLLGQFYIRFGSSLSDRRSFAPNLVILGMTTMLVITVVKSSLALSLGLVGALSIVRFRTAVKEAEELLYLFIAIAVGLGVGAEQVASTAVAFVVLLAALWAGARRLHRDEKGYYVVFHASPGGLDAAKAAALLASHGADARLRRAEDGPQGREFTFLAVFRDPDSLRALMDAARKADRKGSISVLEYHAELA